MRSGSVRSTCGALHVMVSTLSARRSSSISAGRVGYRAAVRAPGDHPTGRSWAWLPRPAAFAVVTGSYLVAAAAALPVVIAMRHHHPVTAAILADLAATLVVFG